MLSSLATRTVDLGPKKILFIVLCIKLSKNREKKKKRKRKGLSFIRHAQGVAVLSVPNNASHPYLRGDLAKAISM